MANPPITRFTSLATAPSPSNPNNGLYVPPLNTAQIAAIPAETKLNGGIWYNNDAGRLEAVIQGKVQPIQVGAGGQGDVVGPNGAIQNNIAIFGDNTGKLIADSGVNIIQVPNPAALLRFSNSLEEAPNALVNEIGNLGHIRFINDVCSIYVDTLTSIRFFPYDDGKNPQVCSVFTSEIGSSGESTSQSALLEINSDSGALLLSRLTDTERDVLVSPVGGMMLFNKTSDEFELYNGINWRTMPLYNPDGTLTVEVPIALKDATNKIYVDTRPITLSGAVTGSGNLGTTIATTLTPITTSQITNFNSAVTAFRLDQFAAPTSSINLSSQKIINLATPTNPNDGATKGYVDTSISGANIAPNTAKYIIQTTTGLLPGELPNAQVLGALGTGLLKNTTTTGVLSIAVAGTDYYSLNNPTRIIDNSVNFFIGGLAGNLSLSGTQNSGLGITSLTGLTTGSFNTAGGYQSSTGATTASRNSSFGYFSLLANLSSNDNCSFGYLTLSANGGVPGFNGHNNVAVGSSAAALRSQYNNCVFLGCAADASANNLTNAIALGYQAQVGADNCMVLGGSGANLLSVGIGITPNAQLQLPTIHANRKIVLYQTANNDHQVYALGTVGTPAGIFRFQLDATTSSYTFNAAASPSSSNELMRLTGTGFLGIGTDIPNAPLQFSSTIANRKIVLFEGTNNDHQFYGIGVNAGIFRFQLPGIASTDSFVFYTASSPSTSTELMRLTGLGVLHAKQSYAFHYANGTEFGTGTSATPGNFVRLDWPAVTTANYNNYSYGSFRLTYSGTTSTAAQVIQVSFSAYINAAAVDTEITTFALYKNGTLIRGLRVTLGINSNSFTNVSFDAGVINVATNDYFEVQVAHSVASRTVHALNFNITISST